jgi:hypothetical protein
MPRKSQTKPLTLGFVGSGEVSEKETKALLDDFIGEREDVTFVVPVTEEGFTDTIEAVLDYATENDIAIEIVTNEASAKKRAFGKYIKAAKKTYKVAGAASKVVTVLASKDGGQAELVTIWDDDDTDLEKACNKALDAELVVRDLSSGLEPVEFETDDDSSEDDSSEDESEVDESEAPADDESQDDDDDDAPYTRDELIEAGEKDRKVLIAIAEDFDIEVPPRTRINTIVDKILAAQEAESDDEVEDATEDETEVLDEKSGTTVNVEDLAEHVAAAVVERLRVLLQPVLESVKAIDEGDIPGELSAVEERLERLERAVEQLGERLSGGASSSDEEPEPDEEPEETPKTTGKRRRRRI